MKTYRARRKASPPKGHVCIWQEASCHMRILPFDGSFFCHLCVVVCVSHVYLVSDLRWNDCIYYPFVKESLKTWPE